MSTPGLNQPPWGIELCQNSVLCFEDMFLEVVSVCLDDIVSASVESINDRKEHQNVSKLCKEHQNSVKTIKMSKLLQMILQECNNNACNP
jgi:hypothetical protein